MAARAQRRCCGSGSSEAPGRPAAAAGRRGGAPAGAAPRSPPPRRAPPPPRPCPARRRGLSRASQRRRAPSPPTPRCRGSAPQQGERRRGQRGAVSKRLRHRLRPAAPASCGRTGAAAGCRGRGQQPPLAGAKAAPLRLEIVANCRTLALAPRTNPLSAHPPPVGHGRHPGVVIHQPSAVHVHRQHQLLDLASAQSKLAALRSEAGRHERRWD